jgi:RNA polymerase sigma-70 factor (ECF subfamily)
MAAVARLKLNSKTPETELIAAARIGDESAIRTLIKANNQRLFRVARAVLKNDGEAEDVVQATYVKAFTKLDSFRGDSAFSTWLTRIALNEALGRKRRQRPTMDITTMEETAEVIAFPGASPEAEAGRHEMRDMLATAIDKLPEPFRLVFVMREIEELDIAETAATLGIKPETVKTRLFRARRLIRGTLAERLTPALADVFPFDGQRCTNLADRVISELRAGSISHNSK